MGEQAEKTRGKEEEERLCKKERSRGSAARYFFSLDLLLFLHPEWKEKTQQTKQEVAWSDRLQQRNERLLLLLFVFPFVFWLDLSFFLSPVLKFSFFA